MKLRTRAVMMCQLPLAEQTQLRFENAEIIVSKVEQLKDVIVGRGYYCLE